MVDFNLILPIQNLLLKDITIPFDFTENIRFIDHLQNEWVKLYP